LLFLSGGRRSVPRDIEQFSAKATGALEQLGRLTLHDHSMESLLESVTELAKTVLPGDTEISVSLLTDDVPTTAASTGELALDCDKKQYAEDAGPCLHAARSGELTEVADNRSDSRWPAYARHAVERGALSSLSVPLILGARMSGCLNIYARKPEAFDESSRTLAARFGPYAAASVANMHAYKTARELADNLEAALQSRTVIDQAKGILMERHKITADQAFQVLAAASMRTNTKLRDVAEQLVMTGALPNP
jgi:GAF domain-containing protein